MVIRFHWRNTSTTPAVPVLLAGKGLLLCKELSGVCGADRITAARGFCFSWCLGKGLTQRSAFRRCGGCGWRLTCVTLALISVCMAGLHFSHISGGVWLQHNGCTSSQRWSCMQRNTSTQTPTAPNVLCCCSVTEVVVSSAPRENGGKITYLCSCWQALPKQLP